MIAQPLEAFKTPNTAAILQLNGHQSHSTTLSLFNDANTKIFLFIALQEPPVNSHTNTPANHSGWNLIVTDPKYSTKASRPRSCIYVNADLGADVRPIASSSRDVSACTVKLHELHLLLINVYNPPRTFDGFIAMDATLSSLPHSIL